MKCPLESSSAQPEELVLWAQQELSPLRLLSLVCGPEAGDFLVLSKCFLKERE